MKHSDEKNVPLIGPRGGTVSTDSLADASPAELADALERVLLSMDEETYDPELVNAYLDALEKKAPIAVIPDAGKAQADFRKRLLPLHTEQAAQSPAHPSRSRGYRRLLVTIAATMAALLALMIGAQAAGIDIFGNLARWTDETFHFVLVEQTPEVSPYYEPLRQVLEDNGLPGELAPKWYPEGFVTQEPKMRTGKRGISVVVPFQNEAGEEFTITISQILDSSRLDSMAYEKDKASAEAYTSGGRTFYIFANFNDTAWAVWSQGELEMRIAGKLSVEQIKEIIDSIGGQI